MANVISTERLVAREYQVATLEFGGIYYSKFFIAFVIYKSMNIGVQLQRDEEAANATGVIYVMDCEEEVDVRT